MKAQPRNNHQLRIILTNDYIAQKDCWIGPKASQKFIAPDLCYA
jgi:hypothetical protein